MVISTQTRPGGTGNTICWRGPLGMVVLAGAKSPGRYNRFLPKERRMTSLSSVLVNYPRWLALALTLALAAGCSSKKGPWWDSLNPSSWSNKHYKDDPVVIDVVGPIGVDIETFAGDVVVEADPKAKAATVTVVREAMYGWGRSGEGKASLGDIATTAELGAADTARGELGQTLRVRATTSGAEPHLQRAHVYVKAPEIDGVRVKTDDGSVDVSHIEGAVDVETSNGNVRVASNRAMRQPVTIIDTNGHIDYRVRGESSAEFDAQTINGRVSGFVKYGTLILKPTSRDDLYQATLNDGTNKVILRTTNGNITIAVVPDAENVIQLRGGPNKPPKEAEKPATSQPEGS
jgi:hypothetical protein